MTTNIEYLFIIHKAPLSDILILLIWTHKSNTLDNEIITFIGRYTNIITVIWNVVQLFSILFDRVWEPLQ